MTLAGLATHLETGAPVNPQEAMAWMGSEDGKALVRRSSTDWGKASVASGTEEGAADAAAARTTAFYTGERGADPS